RLGRPLRNGRWLCAEWELCVGNEHAARKGEQRFPRTCGCNCQRLERGRPVTFGLECPLFWPCPEEMSGLGRQRLGEAGRACFAGAGATITPTGCQSLMWLLRRLKNSVPSSC